MKKLFLLVLVCSLCVMGLPAADWPARQVELVAPFNPGGSTDLSLRALAALLSDAIGGKVYVSNIAGSNGLTGTSYMLNKKPDGYTFVYLGTRPSLPEIHQSNSPYLSTDLRAVAQLVETAGGIVVRADTPWKTFEELVQYLQKNPKTKYTHTGRGNKWHLTSVMLDKAYGLNFTEVPFGGDAEAITAILRGEVGIGFISLTSAIPQQEAGKIRILAVMDDRRAVALPGTPILAETKYPVENIISYIGLFCARGVPDDIVKKMSDAVGKCAQVPRLEADLNKMGLNLVFRPYDQFAKLAEQMRSIIAPLWKEVGLYQ
jgi:tripartite-type tricarboxylate transporter receptor subunit TctC